MRNYLPLYFFTLDTLNTVFHNPVCSEICRLIRLGILRFEEQIIFLATKSFDIVCCTKPLASDIQAFK